MGKQRRNIITQKIGQSEEEKQEILEFLKHADGKFHHMNRAKIDEDNKWRTPTVEQLKSILRKSLRLDEVQKNESNMAFELDSEPSPPKKRSKVTHVDSDQNSELILSDDVDSNEQKKSCEMNNEELNYPSPINVQEEKAGESPTKQDPQQLYRRIYEKLHGPAYTVNERLSIRNMFVFKSVHCKHPNCCYKNIMSGAITRFLKGMLLNIAFKLMLNMVKDITEQVQKPPNLYQRIFDILKQMDFQIVRTGLFTSLFAILFKALQCFMRMKLFTPNQKHFSHFLLGVVASLIMLPIFFTKPYIKIGMFFALALAFECIFKMIFAQQKLKENVNSFQRNYREQKDPKTGQIKFTLIPPEERKRYEDIGPDVQKYKIKKYSRYITEVLIAAFLSMALHSLSYDYGDLYDSMDLSEHESLIHQKMKSRFKNYDQNELDFTNYFFRKVFFHLMSRKGEDNFSVLIFKQNEDLI